MAHKSVPSLLSLDVMLNTLRRSVVSTLVSKSGPRPKKWRSSDRISRMSGIRSMRPRLISLFITSDRVQGKLILYFFDKVVTVAC